MTCQNLIFYCIHEDEQGISSVSSFLTFQLTTRFWEVRWPCNASLWLFWPKCGRCNNPLYITHIGNKIHMYSIFGNHVCLKPLSRVLALPSIYRYTPVLVRNCLFYTIQVSKMSFTFSIYDLGLYTKQESLYLGKITLVSIWFRMVLTQIITRYTNILSPWHIHQISIFHRYYNSDTHGW